MTQIERSSRKVISGSGWANPLSHSFYLENSSHLKVYAVTLDDEGDEVVEELSLGSDYSVSGVADDNGYDVTITTPGDWSAIDSWVLEVQPPIDQPSDTSLGGTFGQRYEDGLDRLSNRIQRVYDLAIRAYKSPLSTDPEELLQEDITFRPTLFTDIEGSVSEAAASAAAAAASAVASDASADEAAAQAVLAAAARVGAEAAQAAAEAAADSVDLPPIEAGDAGKQLFVKADLQGYELKPPASAGFNVLAYGATGDGVTDDTAAVLAALDDVIAAGRGTLFFPAGAYVISETLAAVDKFITFKGEGVGVTKIIWSPSADTILFDVSKTLGTGVAYYTIEDMIIETPVAGAGTAIKLSSTVTAGVIGGLDTLFLNNVVLEVSGTGYWTKGLHIRNAGGVYGNNVSFRNLNSDPVQQNTATKGIHVECTEAALFIIRALHLNNFYMQRFYRGIHFDANGGSIESFYIDNYEVLAHTGVYVSGAGGASKMGAIVIGGGHWNCNRACFLADGLASFVRISADADLRISNNGGAVDANAVAVEHMGALSQEVSIGGQFDAFGASGVTAIKVGQLLGCSIDSATFRDFDVGIEWSSTITEFSIGDVEFRDVTTPYSGVASIASMELALAETLGSREGTFAGDANDLANARPGKTSRRLTGAATNVPLLANTNHLDTMVHDANAARQVLWGAGNESRTFLRGKALGAFGAWHEFDIAPSFYETINTDAGVNLTSLSSRYIRHTGTLTAVRAINLPTTGGLVAGRSRHLITRTGGGAFVLNIGSGPLKTLNTNQWCEVVWDGTAWYLAAFGSL